MFNLVWQMYVPSFLEHWLTRNTQVLRKSCDLNFVGQVYEFVIVAQGPG